MENGRDENLRAYYVVLVIMAVLIVVIGSIDLYLALNPKNTSSNQDTGIVEPSYDNNNQSKKSYMELTKEEALAAYKEMQKLDYLPEGYIGESVIPLADCEAMNSLAYSYANNEDIKNIYNSSYLSQMAQFGSAQFVDDYYAVIFSSPFDYGAASGCLRMFSLKSTLFSTNCFHSF